MTTQPISVPILIPTRDYRSIPQTVIKLVLACLSMGRQPHPITSNTTMLLGARTNLLQLLKDNYKTDVMRGFWIDSDIMLMNEPQELVPIIQLADREHYNIVGNYMKDNGKSVIKLDRGREYDKEEIEKVDNYSVIESDICGLGFYYGDLPLDYKFHAEWDSGEDFHYFQENSLKPRICKDIRLIHIKTVLF